MTGSNAHRARVQVTKVPASVVNAGVRVGYSFVIDGSSSSLPADAVEGIPFILEDMMALKKILADILNDLEKLSVSLAVLEKTAQKKPGIDLKTIRELIANDLQKHFSNLGKAIASLPDEAV